MTPDERRAAVDGLANTELPEALLQSQAQDVSATSPRGRGASGRPAANRIGRYAILEVLGEGGMGTVYAVYDGQLDRKVALKLVKGVASDAARSRMLREAQAMAKLSHPHVVPVFEVGEHDGELFLAMEFVQGQTLRAWRQEAPRSWLQVLEKYLQAGEGLAAAHAQDLVHRDFKPDNAVVGEDGRVRVLDFGLAAKTTEARATAEPVEVAATAEAGLDTPLTATGAVLGTPAYMAAEQFLGEPIDHRTDQFAFCVALWEGLYGQRPFSGDTRLELFNAVCNGTLTEPPASAVPSGIRGLLERGLEAEPEARWPDLPALLRELERRNVNPARRRRVVLGGTTALAIGAGSVWGYGAYQEHERQQQIAACEQDAAEEIEAIYDDGVREAAREGLLATGVSYAETTADKALPWLDEYADTWRAARTEACLATHVEQRWSADDLDRSQWCLEQRAMALDALAQELTAADDTVVNKAVTAAAGLAPIESCRDVALLRRLPEPPAPSERELIAGTYRQLSIASARKSTGQYTQGLSIAAAALEQAKSLDDRRLVSAALLTRGSLLGSDGKYDEAATMLEDAYFEAAAIDDHETAASAGRGLAFIVGYRQAKHEQGFRWSRHARTSLDKLALGPDHPDVAANLNDLATVHSIIGEYAQAKVLHERALAIREKALGPDHPSVATSLSNLATVQSIIGEYAEAEVRYERALAVKEKALGPDHPSVAASLANFAENQRAIGEYAQAKVLHERALAIREKALGPDHPNVALSLNNLALVHSDIGEYTDAKVLHARALAIREKAQGPDHPDVAASLTNLALLHSDIGEYAEAKVLHERALAIREKALGPDHPDMSYSLSNLATVHYAFGEYAEAKVLYERALALWEKALGPDHPNVAFTLKNLAGVLETTGAHEEARPLFERAVSIYDAAEGLQPGELDARFAYAETLVALGQDRPRALAEARTAAAGYREAGEAKAEQLAEVEAWLARHER